MTDGSEDLRQRVDSLADEFGDVQRHDAGESTEYRRGGRPFAALDGGTVEFRLRPDVAAAVLDTPDTRPSRRGPDWVAFGPARPDATAFDRAEAWFRSAWRVAGEPERGRR